KPDKLEPRSIKCIFVEYPKETMGYLFYYQPENKVIVARNAEFLENSLIDQEASERLDNLEIIQEEDTHPSLDTSLNHEEEDLEIDEPQSDIVPIRRSTRTRHAPDRMCLYIDAEEHELGDLGEPTNYKAALLDQESKKWLNAMNVEMQSMKDNEVWVLVELPPNGKTVGSKWLFKKKIDMDGNEKLKLSKSQGASTPAETKRMQNVPYASAEKLKLSKSQGASTPVETKRMQNVPYASAVGSIMHSQRCCVRAEHNKLISVESRWLLDLLLKHKGHRLSEKSLQSNKNLISSPIYDKKPHSSKPQALLQLTLKNQIPFFKLVVDSRSSVLAAGSSECMMVIFPGGSHSLPNSGKPSLLINKQRSGRAFDCGGWDIGCELRVLTNENENNEIPKASTSYCLNLLYKILRIGFLMDLCRVPSRICYLVRSDPEKTSSRLVQSQRGHIEALLPK
nr:zinc finger, CCHC-type [Tanacetum cinerariifolium]